MIIVLLNAQLLTGVTACVKQRWQRCFNNSDKPLMCEPFCNREMAQSVFVCRYTCHNSKCRLCITRILFLCSFLMMGGGLFCLSWFVASKKTNTKLAHTCTVLFVGTIFCTVSVPVGPITWAGTGSAVAQLRKTHPPLPSCAQWELPLQISSFKCTIYKLKVSLPVDSCFCGFIFLFISEDYLFV